MNIWSILEYTVAVSIVGLLILGMKRIFHDKLDARWHYFIWLVLLVRMVVPVDLDWVRTPLSIFQQLPIRKWFEMGQLLVEKRGYEDILALLWKVYLWGAGALALFYLGSWLVLCVRVLCAPKADGETIRYVQEIARKYNLKCCKRVHISESNTPYIFGVISPILVLPANHIRPQESIIVHELLHMRCKDVLINLALHVVRVINWFNPLVWMLCAVVQNDSEALCDQRVLERCGQENVQAYGEMLIELSVGGKRNPVKIGTSNMASSFRNMRTRIQRIKDFRKVPAGIGFVTLCITLMLTVASIGSSAEESGTLKVPMVKSEEDLEMGLLQARCYHAKTPYQAVYLFLRAAKERNLFYRMAVMPEEHVEGYENFAKICLSVDNEEDYGSVETWDVAEYSPYFPREMFEPERFSVYNLEYDEESGSATVCAELSSDSSGMAYAEWKLELVNENGWKVWVSEETDRVEGEYVPEPLLYGSAQLGDFKAEILGFNEGHFSSLNKKSNAGLIYYNGSTMEETFPEFYSNEVRCSSLYVTYVGDEDLTGKEVRIETAASNEEIENVSLVANIEDALDRMVAEAVREAEATGDMLIAEDAKQLADEILSKTASNDGLTREDLELIGEQLGVPLETDQSDKSKLGESAEAESIDWTYYLYGSSSSSDGSGYSTYEGEKLMDGKPRMLTGGGSGYYEPGYGWTAEDQISAYVRIYIDGDLVREGEVWSQNH